MLWTTPSFLHLAQNSLLFFTAVVFGTAAVSVVESSSSPSTAVRAGEFNNDFNADFNL